MNRLRRSNFSWELLAGSVTILCFIIIAVAAPILAPVDPKSSAQPYYRIVSAENSNRIIPQPPNARAWLGTTTSQQDVYYALVWGTRNALGFALLVGLSAFTLGTAAGLLGGFIGGRMNWLLLRITDSFLAVPLIAGVVIMQEFRLVIYERIGGDSSMLFFGEQTMTFPWWFNFITSVELILIVFLWMPYVRLVSAQVQLTKTNLYIEASRALGISNFHLLVNHILPNSITPAVVQLSRDLGGVVLIQAALTYLGLGGGSIWGSLLVTGRDWVFGLRGNPFQYWWVFIPACLVIILFGTGWSLLGDGINNLMHPQES
jgi:peptide/nickel transport system permease protein